MATVKRFILPKSVYTKDLTPTHRGLPTFDPIDNESSSSYAFGSLKAPDGTTKILAIKIHCIKQHAGALELKFILTHSDRDQNAALATLVDSQRSYTLGGSMNQVVTIEANAAFITDIQNNLTIDEGDTVGFAIDRIAPDAYLSDFLVTEIEIEFDATPAVDIATPRLSRDWTAKQFWRKAVLDLQLDRGVVKQFERFELTNASILAVYSQFKSLMWNDYLTTKTVTESGGAVNLQSLRLAREGGSAKFVLHSSTVGLCWPVSLEEFFVFQNRKNDLEHRNRIVYAYDGEQLLIEGGGKVTSLGTLKLRFPRLPTPVALDADKLDLPDGAAIEIALLKLKQTLAQRYKVQTEDPRPEATKLVRSLYESYLTTAQTEELESKVEALL